MAAGSGLGGAVAWAAASTWVRLGVNFVIFALLARLLGPEAFGLVGMVVVVVTFGEVLVGNAPLESLVQRETLEPGHIDSMFWTLVVLGLGLTAAMMAASPLIALGFGQPALTALAVGAAPILFLRSMAALPEGLLRRTLRFRALAVSTALAVVAGGIVGIALAFSGFGPWSLIGSQIANATVHLAASWIAAGYRPRGQQSWRHFNDLRGYNLAVLGTRILGYANTAVPRIAIGVVLGPVALGYFALADRLVDLARTATTRPLSTVGLPAFARVQRNRARVGEMFKAALGLAAVIGFPAFAGLALVAPDLIPLVFGERWVDVVPVLQVLALFGLRATISSFNGTVLRGLGRPEWQFLTIGAGLVIGTVLTLALVGDGVAAVAVAIVLRSVATWPLGSYLVWRLTGISIARQLARLALPAAACIAMVGCVWLTRVLLADSAMPVRLAFSIAVGIAAYGLFLAAVGRRHITAAIKVIRQPG